MISIIKTGLEHRSFAITLALAAFLFGLPAVWSDLFNDDYCQQIELMSPSAVHSDLDAVGLGIASPGEFNTCLKDVFVAVGPNKNSAQFKDYGALPWWTSTGYRVALFRPLATVTHWLDHHWFGGSVTWMHIHNLLWLAVVVLLVARFHRQFIEQAWIAGLAALLFALDDNHYFPSMWIANRNQLMAMTMAILCVLSHHQWRTSQSPWAALRAGLYLVAALLCAEAGITTFAYLFAYALTLDKGFWRKRLASLIPSLLIIIIWRIGYSLAGYGASGGGFYFDPAGQPLDFARVVLQRAPFLIVGQWLSLPPELYSFIGDQSRWSVTCAMAAVAVVIGLLLWPALRKDRSMRFWFIGMHVSIIPVCAAVPMGRNLLFCSIGGFAVTALLIAHVIQAKGTVSMPTKILCGLLVLIHLPLACITKASVPFTTQAVTQRVDGTTDLGDLDDIENKEVYIVNAPNPAAFIYTPFKRASLRQPLPAALRILATGYSPLEIKRPDTHTLTIRARRGSLLTCEKTARLDIVHLYRHLSDFRGPHERLDPTRPRTLPGLTVQIILIDIYGNPLEIDYRFDKPLEEIAAHWLQWNWQKKNYSPFELPEIGGSRTVRGPLRGE